MYNSRIFCILLTITLAIGIAFHAAEAVETISLSTNSDIYYNGDHVVVFGSVNTIFEDVPITIQIYYESNLISIAQSDVAKDGTYVASFYATGSKWKDEGTYTIRAQYTPTQIAETSFEFFTQVIDTSAAVFPVDIPNSGTFDVGYTIRGGEVFSIWMDQSNYSVGVLLQDVNSNGNLILKLPTESFDAKTNGENIDFIVLISKEDEPAEQVQVEYEEIATGDNYRTIRIPLEEGDGEVIVVGTYVIPEFGSIVIIILVVAVSSAIIISKSRFSVRYN